MLDAPLRRDMGNLLREVQRELELAAVLVTHDAIEAAALADKVISYNGGRVIRQGTAREAFGLQTESREACGVKGSFP